MTQVKEGDKVRVNYKGTLEDGTVFDTTQDREPMEFTLGEGMILPGFEKAVIGLSVKDTTSVSLAPDEAYGQYDEKQVVSVDRSEIPTDVELEPGMVLQVAGEDGQAFNVTLTDISEDAVTLDGNHPLAGESLTFEIELLEIL